MSTPGDHIQNPAHIFLGPPPGDWEVVEAMLGGPYVSDEGPALIPMSQMVPLMAALSRLREREAQTAELYEQKIERIEELEREVKRQEDEKWAAENRADEAEARVRTLEARNDDPHWMNRAQVAEARVAELERERSELSLANISLHEHATELEARVARLEECVGLLPPKWADQFWFNWREHPGLPALAHEEEA